MREELTKTLRQAIERAQVEARELNQEFVGTEHLLLGVIKCDTCEAARAMQRSHVNINALRSAIVNDLPRGAEPPVVTGSLPLSPKAQRAINAAMARAQALREPRISTRFLLLALLDDPQTMIHQAVVKCGGDVDHLTQAVATRAPEPEE